MAPTNKDLGATRRAGAHTVPGVTTPGARHAWPSGYSRFFEEASALPAARSSEQQGGRSQRHADHCGGFEDPELLENLINMEMIDADSVDDCTDESVMEFLQSKQERDASVTAKFVKAEVLAKVTFVMSAKDPALRVMKATVDYISLLRNLRLDFINGNPKNAVEHPVSVIRPATLKSLIESELANWTSRNSRRTSSCSLLIWNVDEWRVLRSSHTNLASRCELLTSENCRCQSATQKLHKFELATEIQFYQILIFCHFVNTWTGQNHHIAYTTRVVCQK
jgi:hypothetical protein